MNKNKSNIYKSDWIIEKWKFKDLMNIAVKDNIQRDFVWGDNNKSRELIDSIKRHFPIGTFLAIKEKNGNKKRIKIYDGWQRFCIINNFLSKNKKEYEYLNDLEIPIIFYTGDSTNINEIFQRVNLNSVRLDKWDRNNIFLDHKISIKMNEINNDKYKNIFKEIISVYEKDYKNKYSKGIDIEKNSDFNPNKLTTKIFLTSLNIIGEKYLKNITNIQKMFSWQVLYVINKSLDPTPENITKLREWLEKMFSEKKYHNDLLLIFKNLKEIFITLNEKCENIFYYKLGTEKILTKTILKFSNDIIYYMIGLIYFSEYKSQIKLNKNLNIPKILFFLWLTIFNIDGKRKNFNSAIKELRIIINERNIDLIQTNLDNKIKIFLKEFFNKQRISNYRITNIKLGEYNINKFIIYKLSRTIFYDQDNSGSWNHIPWTIQHNPSQDTLEAKLSFEACKNIGVLQLLPRNLNSALNKNTVTELTERHNKDAYTKAYYLYRKFNGTKDKKNIIDHINKSIETYWCSNGIIDLIVHKCWKEN